VFAPKKEESATATVLSVSSTEHPIRAEGEASTVETSMEEDEEVKDAIEQEVESSAPPDELIANDEEAADIPL
jgi:hypothetical protein